MLDDATLHFANNQAVLSPEGVAAIRAVARSLKAYPGTFDLLVTGHTSRVGSRAHNLALSGRRAEAVVTVLVEEGIPAQRIRSQGMGPDRPIADDATKAGEARNRRVEIEVKAAGTEVRHNVVGLEQPGAPAPARKRP